MHCRCIRVTLHWLHFCNFLHFQMCCRYSYYYEHGRCYTFRPGPGHFPPPGSQYINFFELFAILYFWYIFPTRYGLKFIMNYKYFPIQNSEKSEGNFSDKSFGGWDIFVHDPDEDWWVFLKNPDWLPIVKILAGLRMSLWLIATMNISLLKRDTRLVMFSNYPRWNFKGAGVFGRPGQNMEDLGVFGTSRSSN